MKCQTAVAVAAATLFVGTAAAVSCSEKYPQSAAFFGSMGCASALIFANLGSAYGTAKSGVGVAHLGILHADRIMRGIVPVVMAGILGIYGLIVAVIINDNITAEDQSYSSFAGYLHFGAGLAAGLSSLAAGLSIGIAGDASARAYGKQEKIFVAMILMKCQTAVAVAAATLFVGTAAAVSCSEKYPQSAAFFGSMGCASALIFANLGSAYGTAKSGVGVAHLGILHADRIMRGIVPVVMAGILGIYGLIVAVIINDNITAEDQSYSSFAGYLHFGAGLAAGLSSLAAGLSIGIAGDASARAYGKQEKIFVAMILMLIFAEALGLYGLIIALLMNNTAGKVTAGCS
ncbi:hypothetical protein JKF63_05177 [Porcisia hertigi]|uniref:V-type proton ATPase proteolipid subunit n=1 Tax=Porcisia hertigi TaxID=2761500 RepID=A0A836ITD9_9TRYP|nr:hypothetical protein JKF63_05177 [Porcisia hertigi]